MVRFNFRFFQTFIKSVHSLQDAVLAELINRLYPKWIVKYHEHDSLLQNRPEEELTEAERKEAWDQWELEKQGILNRPQVGAEQIPRMFDSFYSII